MEAGGTPPPGSFLSRFHQDLDDPAGLGSFRVTHEDKRSSRAHERPREELWTRFLRDVNAYVFTIMRKLRNYFLLIFLKKTVMSCITAGPSTLHRQPHQQS